MPILSCFANLPEVRTLGGEFKVLRTEKHRARTGLRRPSSSRAKPPRRTACLRRGSTPAQVVVSGAGSVLGALVCHRLAFDRGRDHNTALAEFPVTGAARRIGQEQCRLTMAAIEIQSLTKWYGRARGVEDVTFSIEAGEVFGYLGPNGSGKTTTIRCLMGLLRPSGGEVCVLGERVVPGRGTQHTRMGYLPGEFRIWSRLRSRHSLRVLAGLGGRDVGAARREELAARLELDLHRPVGDLSKGNRQKVAVICAFQHQPEVLILDEPTSGLDPLMRQAVLDLIREAADAGAAVLLSSHDLSEVSAVCTRAAIIREGRLVEVAPIAQIVEQGEHRLKIWFTDGTLMLQVPADQLPHVRVVERMPGMLHLAYQGAADAILKWVTQFPVDRIATPQTSLEEAFMQYYHRPPNAGDGAAKGARS